MARILEGVLLLVLMDEMLWRAAESKCPRPSISKGTFRIRPNNKMVRYTCWLGYELLGDKYANCVDGEWDSPPPVCTKPGCQRLPALVNGMQYYYKRNAIVMFFCSPGFQVEGASHAYCDGRKWNGTQPHCVLDVTDDRQILECNFEDGLCGWMHDPNHDFDWRRQSGLPSEREGYYMTIHSGSGRENDTARLLSPLYPPSLSKNGCFVFYYRMFGRTTGTLRVYVHPQSVDLMSTDVERRKNYLLFEKTGDRGNGWHRGFFDLAEVDENFQIVIEGVRGSGYTSDVSVDDIAIKNDDKCNEIRSELSALHTAAPTLRDSCWNRCNSAREENENGELYDCKCFATCGDDPKGCCVDYRDYCIFDSKDTTFSEGNDPTTLSDLREESLTYISTLDDYPRVPSKPESTTLAEREKSTPRTVTVAETKTIAPRTIAVTVFSDLGQTTLGTAEIPHIVRNTTQSDEVRLDTKNNRETENDFYPTTETNMYYSKSFKHYGKHENGTGIINGNKNSTQVIYFTKDAHYGQSDDKSPIESSNRAPLYVVLSIIAVVAVVVVIKIKLFDGTDRLTMLKNALSVRSQSARDVNNGDMRFLVENEELEEY